MLQPTNLQIFLRYFLFQSSILSLHLFDVRKSALHEVFDKRFYVPLEISLIKPHSLLGNFSFDRQLQILQLLSNLFAH